MIQIDDSNAKLQAASEKQQRHSLFRSAFTQALPTFFVLISLLLHYYFRDLIGDNYFLLFYPAIFLGTLFGNFKSNFFATALATSLSWYFFVPPVYSFKVIDEQTAFAIGVFFFSGTALSFLSGKIFEAHLIIRDNANQFRTLAESLPQHAWLAQPNGDVYWFNDRWYQYTATRFESSRDMKWLSLVDPKHSEAITKKLLRYLQSPNAFELEVPLRGQSGEYRWFLIRVQPIKDHNDRLVKWFGTNTDIDSQHRSSLALRSSEQRLSLALDTAYMGFWDRDISTNTVVWNENLRKQFGFAENRHFGHLDEILSRIHMEDIEKFHLVVSTALESGAPYSIEFRIRSDKNDVRWIMAQARIDLDEKGQPVRVMGTTLDITSRKQIEADLTKAKEDAERANELKSAFLANMSHEIRTPLGAMIGFADLLRDHSLESKERQSYLDILTRNGEQLSYIINDILDLSKVEAGHLIFDYSKTNPLDVANDVLSLYSMKAKEKNIELVLKTEPSVNRDIVTDPIRLKQVLSNLVNNAIKFTFEGSVTVRISSSSQEHRQFITFEIEDSGIGIPDDQHEKIFQVFVQGDGSMTRRFGGTGLGLSLSRKLARSLNGDIRIKQSQPGMGTTFVMTIEDESHREVSAQLSSHTEESNALTSKENQLAPFSILVADDSEDNRQLIKHYLTKHGAHVDFAENGVEAVDYALAGHYDAVVMDIQMPIMDGYTATAKLRDRGYEKPIIALTAHAMTEVRKKCLNVGCTDQLTKPINPKSLITTISTHIKK